MAVYTQNDMDRKLMMKIIGGFLPGDYRITPDMAMKRHFGRMIMLVRWTFLRYCQKKARCNELSLEGFGYGMQRATVCMWMDEPYMQMYKTGGESVILAQLSVETLKELYKYIKGLD